MYNPFAPALPYQQPQMMYQQTQQQTVVRVNGENGARAYQIGPNSSALLLDESGVILWVITTDGAGYKTVCDYDILPRQRQLPVNYGDLESRIKRLEDMINDTANLTAAQRKHGKPDDGAD